MNLKQYMSLNKKRETIDVRNNVPRVVHQSYKCLVIMESWTSDPYTQTCNLFTKKNNSFQCMTSTNGMAARTDNQQGLCTR